LNFTVARFFRLWVKKRGDRRTGSRVAGGAGEAFFFGVLFLLGVVSLAGVLIDQLLDPTPGLLRPGFGFWVLFLALTSFVVIGGVGLIFAVMHMGTSAERRSALVKQATNIEILRNDLPAIPTGENLINSPGVTLAYRLPISQSPAGRLLAATIVFLLLTGITAIVAVLAAREHQASQPDWFLTFFVGVLVFLEGLVTWYFLRQLWQHTRIGPTCVEISHHPLRPGHEYAIFVSQQGRVMLQGLRMSLVCEEEATYQQGTDIRTEFQAIHEQLIFSRCAVRIDPAVPFELQASLHVPRHAMHSFQSGHNAVRWKLIVKAEPEKWPMFVRSFPVLVHPARNGSPQKTSEAPPRQNGSAH
jgi:hypothetical protein